MLLDYSQHLHMVWLFVLKHLCILLISGTQLCDIKYVFFFYKQLNSNTYLYIKQVVSIPIFHYLLPSLTFELI